MWPRENVVKLLNIYKKFPSLYDSNHPDYLNKYKRGKTYENLLDHVKKFDPSMDIELLKIKIHTIRSQLLKELRTEYLFYKTRPPGSKEVFESKYWAFDRLQFLKPFCTVKKYNLLKKNYDLIKVKEEESNDAQDSWINMSPKDNNESMDAISDEQNSEWINWTRELTEELIIQYEMHPILYDIDHPDHLYHFRRAKAYEKILTELRKTSPNLRIDLIKRKLHSLRNQFVKEYQAEQKSQEKGSDIDEIYVPKLWCYTQLSFLKQFCKQVSSQSISKTFKQSISDDNSDGEDSIPIQKQRENDVSCNRMVQKFKDSIDDDSDGLSDNPADDDDSEDDVDDDDNYDDLGNYDYDDCDDDFDDPLFGTDIVNNSTTVTTKIKGGGRGGKCLSSASLKRKFETESRLPNQFIKYENNNSTSPPLRKQQKYHRREKSNPSPLSSISPPPKSPTPPLRRIPNSSTVPTTPKLSTNDSGGGGGAIAATTSTTTRQTAERERYYENLCEQILQKVNDSLEKKVTDEYDLIGKQIAFKLRKLSVDVKTMAEKFINDILFHAEIGNINKRTIMDIKTETMPPTPTRSRPANHFIIPDNVNGLLNINN